MRLLYIAGLALVLLAAPLLDALAQQTYPQMPINMEELQKVQTEYQELKKQKEQERKALTDRIAAEEVDRAKKEQVATGSAHDPYAVAEMRTRERVQRLTPEWEKEDRELEVQMHQKMMQNSGMGDMHKMQQEMMKSYGYTTPPAK